jgi:uncharacterized metal-binding protein
MINKGNYTDLDKIIMDVTKKSFNKSRLQELINFINESNFKKIGIANCLSMQSFADKLIEILIKNKFEVFSINCKDSKLTNKDLFNEGENFLCDPISQANYLNSKNTDLNINVGLCLGHGLLFNKYSKAPVTTFIVKDFATSHKSIENLIE